MTTITIEREVLDEIVELFDSAITARFPHEILRDLQLADMAIASGDAGEMFRAYNRLRAYRE